MSEEEIEPTAHNVLKAIYLNPDEPTSVRMKAAGIAIAYERPKLSAIQSFTVSMSIGAQLSRASERLREHRRTLIAAGMDPAMASQMPFLELTAEPEEDNKKSEAITTSLPVLGLRRRI